MVIAGIDEVGRGCWAGPVVAGAVVLADAIPGLKDSKLLSKKQRERLAAQVEVEALAVGIGWAQAVEVDELGMTEAVRLAMQRALELIIIPYGQIIIDGSLNFLAENPTAVAIVKADQTVPAVSAASIVAKVARDKYMAEACVKYPGYGFDKHVGYGTALHLEMLKLHGVSELHRKSFKPIRELAA
ncbi:MAG TPA: ribonuclease HII [Candidatus Saccharimonadia bacterium]|nr:ribonuclease HII [Candidatus Saccharimonadia bacterium]